jgi:hypothetical protein
MRLIFIQGLLLWDLCYLGLPGRFIFPDELNLFSASDKLYIKNTLQKKGTSTFSYEKQPVPFYVA